MKNIIPVLKKNVLELSALLLIFIIIIFPVIMLVRSSDSGKESLLTEMTAFSEIISRLEEWSGDFQIQGCYSSLNPGEELSSWTCNVYSPGKKQIRLAIWHEEDIDLSSPVEVEQKYIDQMANKPSFNNLEELISIEKLIEIAKEQGLNIDSSSLNIFIGEATVNDFDNRYVWCIEEWTQSETSPDQEKQLTNEYFVDALTGEFLKKI